MCVCIYMLKSVSYPSFPFFFAVLNFAIDVILPLSNPLALLKILTNI
jgi:hypothetical protein